MLNAYEKSVDEKKLDAAAAEEEGIDKKAKDFTLPINCREIYSWQQRASLPAVNGKFYGDRNL